MKSKVVVDLDLEELIGMVNEQFYDVASYCAASRSPKGHNVAELYRTQEVRGWVLYDMCLAFGVNHDRLCSIARMVNRWERVRNWERCFPVDENAERIWNYIRAAE